MRDLRTGESKSGSREQDRKVRAGRSPSRPELELARTGMGEASPNRNGGGEADGNSRTLTTGWEQTPRRLGHRELEDQNHEEIMILSKTKQPMPSWEPTDHFASPRMEKITCPAGFPPASTPARSQWCPRSGRASENPIAMISRGGTAQYTRGRVPIVRRLPVAQSCLGRSSGQSIQPGEGLLRRWISAAVVLFRPA